MLTKEIEHRFSVQTMVQGLLGYKRLPLIAFGWLPMNQSKHYASWDVH